MKDVKKYFAVAANAVLMATGAVLLWFGVLSAYRGNSTLLAVCIAGAILLIFAATIDRFESVKGLGVEATTRKLDQKLEEADQVLEQLRQLAEILGTESVAANSKLGRMGSAPTTEESYLHAQAIKRVMAQLGFKPEAVQKMLRPFVRMMLFDLTTAILSPVGKNLNDKLQEFRRYQVPADESPEDAAARNAIYTAAYEFKDLLLKDLYANMAIEDYPHEILRRLSLVPLIDSEVREVAQREVASFGGDMLLLRAEGRLENTEGWFARVSAYRENPLSH